MAGPQDPVDPALRDFHEQLKSTLGGVYATLSPRQAMERALIDPNIDDQTKTDLKSQFGENYAASFGKSFGRSLGAEGLAAVADVASPLGWANKALGGKPFAERVTKTLETAPYQDGWNTAARFAGGGTGMIAANVGPQAVLGKLAYAPAAITALRAVLQGASAANQVYGSQKDEQAYGERETINPYSIAGSAATSAAGQVVGAKLVNPIQDRLTKWGAPYLAKGSQYMANGPAGPGRYLTKPLEYAKGAAINSLGVGAQAGAAGLEEGFQGAVVEPWWDAQHKTPEGRQVKNPDFLERALLGAVVGGGTELGLKALLGGHGAPIHTDPLKDIEEIGKTGSSPASGPIDPVADAHLSNRAKPLVKGAILQKPPIDPTSAAISPATLVEEGTSPQTHDTIQQVMAHRSIEDIQRLTAAAQYVMERDPRPKHWFVHRKSDQRMPVWRIEGELFGRRPDGNAVHLGNFDPREYDVVRLNPRRGKAPRGEERSTIRYESEHRLLPGDAQLKVTVEGQPWTLMTRKRGTKKDPDRTYGAIPGHGGFTPGQEHRTQPLKLPAVGFDAERAQIDKAIKEAAEAIADRIPSKVTDPMQLTPLPTREALRTALEGMTPDTLQLLRQVFGFPERVHGADDPPFP